MVTRRYTVLESSIIAWFAFILIVFTVTIVCLALGLRNYYTNKYELTEQQKLQDCKDIGCKNGQLLECKLRTEIKRKFNDNNYDLDLNFNSYMKTIFSLKCVFFIILSNKFTMPCIK